MGLFKSAEEKKDIQIKKLKNQIKAYEEFRSEKIEERIRNHRKMITAIEKLEKMVGTDTNPPVRRTNVRRGRILFVAKKRILQKNSFFEFFFPLYLCLPTLKPLCFQCFFSFLRSGLFLHPNYFFFSRLMTIFLSESCPME